MILIHIASEVIY